MQNSILHALTLNRKVALSCYKYLLRTKGMVCHLHFPAEETRTIFGWEDIVAHEETDCPCGVCKRLLCYNIFQETEIGGEDYSAFMNDAYILTEYDNALPIQTLVDIEFFGNVLSFKVDSHQNYIPHIKEQLFIKNMLVPAT